MNEILKSFWIVNNFKTFIKPFNYNFLFNQKYPIKSAEFIAIKSLTSLLCHNDVHHNKYEETHLDLRLELSWVSSSINKNTLSAFAAKISATKFTISRIVSAGVEFSADFSLSLRIHFDPSRWYSIHFARKAVERAGNKSECNDNDKDELEEDIIALSLFALF